MTLNWDQIHLQSREQLCQTSGVRLQVASLKWNEIDTWLREILRSNSYGFGLE